MTYVIPALVLGIILSIITHMILNSYLVSTFQTSIPVYPTFKSAALSLITAIFIPIISSLIPIRIVLQKNLSEAIDTSRSKT